MTRLVALLSFYDEKSDWLSDTVRSLAKASVDHVVALDGAYALFPGALARSDPAQPEAIIKAAADAGIGCTVHIPNEPFAENEPGKRRLLFKLGFAHDPDWFLVIDADETITEAPADLKDRLAATDRNAGLAALLNEPAATAFSQWDSDMPYIVNGRKVWPLRCLFRAIPGLTVGRAHHNYITPDGKDLWGVGREPALSVPDLVMDHRREDRPTERRARADAYYAMRDRLRIERSPKRVFVVGMGVMGQHHKRVLEELPGLDDVRTIDPHAEADYENLDDLPDANMAVVATPPELLCEVAHKCLDRGLNLLVEKPLALSLKDADELIHRAGLLQLTLHVGYVERFNPVFKVLREMKVGRIYHAHSRRLGPSPGRPTAGVLLDLITHDLDILDRYFGAREPNVANIEGDDRSCQMTLDKPFPATLEASYDHPEKVRTLTVECDAGTLEFDYQAQTVHLNGTRKPTERREPLVEQWHHVLGTRGTRDEGALRVLSTALGCQVAA